MYRYENALRRGRGYEGYIGKQIARTCVYAPQATATPVAVVIFEIVIVVVVDAETYDVVVPGLLIFNKKHAQAFGAALPIVIIPLESTPPLPICKLNTVEPFVHTSDGPVPNPEAIVGAIPVTSGFPFSLYADTSTVPPVIATAVGL